MMTDLKIENFRIHKCTEIKNIGNMLAIVGKNDIGKSSVLEAMEIHFNGTGFADDDKNDTTKKVQISTTINGHHSCEPPKGVKYLYFRAENYTDTSIENYTVSDLIGKHSANFHNQERVQVLKQRINDILEIYECVNNLSKSKDINLKDLADKFVTYRDVQVFVVSREEITSRNPDYNRILNIVSKDNVDVRSEIENFDGMYRLVDTSNAYGGFYEFLSEGDSSYVLELDEDDIELEDDEYESEAADALKSIQQTLRNSLLYAGEVNIDSEYLRQYEEYGNLLSNGDVSEILKAKPKILLSVETFCNNLLNEDIASRWKGILEAFDTNKKITISKRGSGVRRLCSLFNFVVEQYRSVSVEEPLTIFAIDEPEISLHPGQQRELTKKLAEISAFPNVQVFLTTHSPYIVKQLSEKDICVLRKVDNRVVSDILGERCFQAFFSLNEINYIAFEEPSTEYHDELYSYIQNVKCCNVGEVDKFVKKILEYKSNDSRLQDFYFVDENNGKLRYNNQSTPQHGPKTLPYCVRNQTHHPIKYDNAVDDDTKIAAQNNNRYSEPDLVMESIEILRKVISHENFWLISK